MSASPTLDKLTFTLSSDGTYYSVKALNTSISGEVVIPTEYEGRPVKEIENNAFEGCLALTSIDIPDGVTSIGDWSFQSCSALTCVNIPNSVTSINECTFEGCSALTSIVIPDSVTEIGYYAFGYCFDLKTVIIKGKPTVSSNAFFNPAGTTLKKSM